MFGYSVVLKGLVFLNFLKYSSVLTLLYANFVILFLDRIDILHLKSIFYVYKVILGPLDQQFSAFLVSGPHDTPIIGVKKILP